MEACEKLFERGRELKGKAARKQTGQRRINLRQEGKLKAFIH